MRHLVTSAIHKEKTCFFENHINNNLHNPKKLWQKLKTSVLPNKKGDGRLRSGDMLLRIGAVCVVGMCARQAAAVLRQCGARVRLLVARPATQAELQSLGGSSAPVVPSRLLSDPVALERRLAAAGHDAFAALADPPDHQDPPPTIIEERLHHR
ncbi:hypothetical protein ACJJTC_004574, partial [Scirpophaga incertulas]